jgi:hypothetical protein
MRAAEHAPVGWESGAEEEDTLTGDLGATLRREWSIVVVNGGIWNWRVTYKKFRGRGPGADEKHLGADGIFEIEVSRNSEVHVKGVLFQAKKRGRRDRRLESQARRMEDVAKGGSAIFEYGPEHYNAIATGKYLDELSAEVRRSGDEAPWPLLGDFLGNDFLPCKTGLRGMYYDAVRGVLVLPAAPARRIALNHRIRVEALLLT